MIEQPFLWAGTAALATSAAQGLGLASIQAWTNWTRNCHSGNLERQLREQVQNQLRGCYREACDTFRSQRWRSLLVARVIRESHDTLSFCLVDSSGQPLPSFLPGQHVLVEADVGDTIQRRCYSLSNHPHLGFWRITIKATDGNRGHPAPSQMSRWLHQHAREGTRLRVRGPLGTFHAGLAESLPMVLMAAGVGITPMMSMVEDWASATPRRDLHLFYQCRDAEHEVFASRLRHLQQQCPEFKLHVFHSRPSGPLTSPRSPKAGRFGAQDIYRCVQSTRSTYFLCGPEAWMNAMQDQLAAIGIASTDIHRESFGGGRNHAAALKLPASGVTVSFLKAGRSAVYRGDQGSLLDFAKHQKVSVDSGCGQGSCGSCLTGLLKGKVRFAAPPQCEMVEGKIPLCVAIPETDLTLDA